MMKKRILKNKGKIILLAIFGGLLILSYISRKLYDQTMRKGVYYIGTINNIHGMSRSSSLKVIFKYNNDQKGSHYFNEDSIKYYSKNVNNRFLVKVNSNKAINYIFQTYKLYIEHPVPDSIKSAPVEGWKELPEWAKDKMKKYNR
ncbi:hypothetical protein [Bergeyella sp. RCAD1439]|uniref:hypothetical protein n=1 Tax=Bergeyella anatis TaxID=3113737 RepID=UPI002E19E83E|nr:hypothetical protein [Bergeyella sp. RCAD1439]